MEITKALTISTAHVKKETAKSLDLSSEQFSPSFPIVYKKGEYGWIIHIPEKEFEDEYNIPEDLECCMHLARENDCDWLCLDRDGEVLKEIPTYEW